MKHIKWSIFCFSIITILTGAIADDRMEILRQYAAGQFVPFPKVAQIIKSDPDGSLSTVIQLLNSGNAEQQTLLLSTLETSSMPCSSLGSTPSILLRSPNWPVRAASLKFIRSKQCRDQRTAVRQLLSQESDSRVAAIAATAIAAIGNINDGPFISQSVNCPAADKICQIHKESALRKLGQPHNKEFLLNALRNPDESIQRVALQCFEDTSDSEIITAIEADKSFPHLIQYFRDYTSERMKINSYQSPAQKEEALWQSLNKDNPVLAEWAAETLLTGYPSTATQIRLKDVLMNSLDSLTGTSNEKISALAETPARAALMNVLVNYGVLTQEEIAEKLNK